MRYEHDNDLRDDYPLPMVLDVLKNPFYRDSWHDRAESGNFLNKLGHGAIRRALATKSGIADAELGGLGSMIYEIATMPEFTLADEVEEPTYHDVGGMRVAMESAFLLENYDSVELLTTSFEVVKVLEDEAPVLSGLMEWSARDILGSELSDSDVHRIKVGAGLIRALHITAQCRLDLQ